MELKRKKELSETHSEWKCLHIRNRKHEARWRQRPRVGFPETIAIKDVDWHHWRNTEELSINCLFFHTDLFLLSLLLLLSTHENRSYACATPSLWDELHVHTGKSLRDKIEGNERLSTRLQFTFLTASAHVCQRQTWISVSSEATVSLWQQFF